MRRDFVFLVQNVPAELYVGDAHFFFASVGETIKAELGKLGEEFSEIKQWLRGDGPISVAAFRYDCENQELGFTQAYQALSGICDGYSLLAQDHLPTISSLVQIRDGEAENATLHLFTAAHLKTDPLAVEERQKERSNRLLQRLLPLFDVVATNNTHPQTELSDQLRLSLKTQRHASTASDIGIEFLCKFNALELIVCGDEEKNKRRVLKKRLSSLFKGQKNWDEIIDDLWELRSGSSHHNTGIAERFVRGRARLEFLALGVFVFATDHLGKCQGIDELWNLARSYQLPPEVSTEPEIPPSRISQVCRSSGIQFTGVGKILDAHFSGGIMGQANVA